MKESFQIVVVVIFLVAGVLGVLVFSGAIPIGRTGNEFGASGNVVLWGTARSSVINPVLNEFNMANPDFTVTYVEKSPETFNQDLLEAMATQRGPDMFFLPDSLVYSYKNKIIPMPYSNVSSASFRKSFVGAGDVFLTSSGILAMPIGVDPMVMYYNRGMLEAKGVVFAPEYWDEFSEIIPVLNEKDSNQTIIKSAIALGHFSNIQNAKGIISTLFLQSGNPIIKEEAGSFVPVLSSGSTKYSPGSVLEFYTNFADPLSPQYSWNRSFPNSSIAFSSEDLVFYFDYASKFKELITTNPNQNFFVAPMPQQRGESFKATSANVFGLAVASSSRNMNTAFYAISQMTGSVFASKFAEALGVVPARRDLLAKAPGDSYSPVFYISALYSRSWLDPSPRDTDEIFRNAVEAVLSGSMTGDEAVRDAESKMYLILNK